jgi:hypothetical protein
MVFIVFTPVGHGPMRGVTSCVDHPFRFSFHVVVLHVLGTNDPGIGGIDPQRAFGSGSWGGEAGAGSRSFPCRPRRALIVTAGLAASRWRRTSPPGEAEALPSVKSSHSGPRTVLDNTT